MRPPPRPFGSSPSTQSVARKTARSSSNARADPREAGRDPGIRGFRVRYWRSRAPAVMRATFDGTDRSGGPRFRWRDRCAGGATRLRVIAEVNGQFSQEETALLTQEGRERQQPSPTAPLKPDAP